MMKIPGINIQWPWSELIVEGKKIIETRSYPIPRKYIGKELAVIQTPGPNGKKQGGINEAKIIGIVKFSGSYKYKTKSEWLREYNKHLVSVDNAQFKFCKDKEKWAWVVVKVKRLKSALPAPRIRGIIFASSCTLPDDVDFV